MLTVTHTLFKPMLTETLTTHLKQHSLCPWPSSYYLDCAPYLSEDNTNKYPLILGSDPWTVWSSTMYMYYAPKLWDTLPFNILKNNIFVNKLPLRDWLPSRLETVLEHQHRQFGDDSWSVFHFIDWKNIDPDGRTDGQHSYIPLHTPCGRG